MEDTVIENYLAKAHKTYNKNVQDQKISLIRINPFLTSTDKEFVKKLNTELIVFINICENETNDKIIRKIVKYYVEVYKLDFEYSGFYYRELDLNSKQFCGDITRAILLKFQNALYEFFCDYFLLRDDSVAFKKELMENSLYLSRGYVMRSFFILLEGYKECLLLPVLGCHLIDPIESVYDKNKVLNIRHLKISKAFNTYLSKCGIALSSEFIFETVTEAMNDWEKDNPDWHLKIFNKEEGWNIVTGYANDTDYSRIGGLFNLHIWCNGHDFPFGHRFSKNMLPIAECETVLSKKHKYIVTRQDSLLDMFGERISFNKIIENHIREKVSIPRVNEGRWINEIFLLNKIKAMTTYEVIHQWSPDWLGRMRIDIAVPDLRLAFEYNGKQHYEAIEYFGGEEGLKQTKKRDKRKSILCKKNQILLIVIRYDLEEDKLIELLKKFLEVK